MTTRTIGSVGDKNISKNLEIVSPLDECATMNEVAVKYDLDKCVEWIKARGLERVCLQFPDSMLPDSARAALYLEECLGKKVYILGDTTCGACCVDEIAADHVKADGILHFGHACLNPTERLQVFHIFEKRKIDVDTLARTIKQYFDDPAGKILLFYDVAYAHIVEKIEELLKSKYFTLTVTKLCCVSNVNYATTSNECATSDIIASGRTWILENGYKIEDYEALYIGNNDKTLATLALSLPAKYWYHTLGAEIVKFEIISNSWLKRRRYLVERLKDASIVGIVVATLGIKNYLDALNAIKQILKMKNKKYYVFSVGKPNPAKLANFLEVDAFVVIACPENEIFDSNEFYKPLLTPYEVELAFNTFRDSTTRYCLDFRQILPGGTNYVEFKATDDTDMSLLTGKLRNSEIEISPDTTNALTRRDPGTVTIGKTGANFLNARSWTGVKQKLGEDEAKPAEKGRCGLPTAYENEQTYR